MKPLFLIRLAALLAFCLPSGTHAQMVAANDRVRVEVRVETQSNHKDIAKSSTDQVTQHKTLNIQLSGKPRDSETRVIKWTAYGRDMKSNDQRILDTGEIKVQLGPGGQQTIGSKRVSTTYTPEHSVVSNSRGRGRSIPKAKRVDGSGVKYIGYAVQVLDGSKVVGEVSDPAGLNTRK